MPADEKPAKKPWSRLGAERTGSNLRFQPTGPLAAVQRLNLRVYSNNLLFEPPFYGSLVTTVEFYFLSNDGRIDHLR